MVTRSRLLAALAALLAVGAVPATAAAFNHAKFDLIIEGHATAKRVFTLSGQASICEESLGGTFEQKTTFLRGKGVTIELVRKKVGAGWEYGATRLGTASAITVVATSTRSATGEQSFKRAANAPFPVQCPEEGTKDLSKTGECGVVVKSHVDVGLHFAGNTFSIVQKGDSLAAPLKNVCGETEIDKGLVKMAYEWPDFTPLEDAPIPDAKLFSGLHAVKVDLNGLTPPPKTEAFGTYPLTGTATDTGDTEATVRFIRCGVKHYPRC